MLGRYYGPGTVLGVFFPNGVDFQAHNRLGVELVTLQIPTPPRALGFHNLSRVTQ